MCLMLYIGTAEELPLGSSQDLRVERVSEARHGVKQWFSHPAVQFVGAHTGVRPPFCRIAELHFPSMEVLQSAAASSPAQKAVAHAVSISSGGTPIFLVGEEEIREF